jgi:hypothetical protein
LTECFGDDEFRLGTAGPSTPLRFAQDDTIHFLGRRILSATADDAFLAGGPDPLWFVEEGLFFEFGFAEVFEEVEAGAEWSAGELVDEKGCVGDDDYLGVCGGCED